MTLENPPYVPVLVVGGGPTGLMMASELARHHVQCRVIDQALVPSDKSRALAIQSRTLEIFDNLGIADDIIAAGHQVHGFSFFSSGKRIIHASFDEVESHYRFILMMPQSETEAFLSKHLANVGLAVERGAALTDFTQDEGIVTASIRHPDGRVEKCKCDYLIGCDGAHSTVRHNLQLSFDGSQYPEHFVLADVQVRWQMPDDELYGYFSSGGEGLLAFFPFRGGRYRVMGDIGEHPPDAEPTLAEVQALVDRRGPAGTQLTDPRWLSHFTIHRRQVSQYRTGRVFLAGDAAHIHSPAGGQGMNSGLQDAYNLGWKLGLVVSGAGNPSLLDSYHTERHAVGQAVLKMSDKLTKVASLRSPVAQALRNQLAPILSSLDVIRQRMTKNITELDVNYRRSPIVAAHRSSILTSIVENVRGAEVRNWLEFGGGPAPGERAPDAEPVRFADGASTRLFRLLRGARHTLLLFGGTRNNGAQHAALATVAQNTTQRHGQHITAYLVLSGANTLAGSDDAAGSNSNACLILDPELALHRAYNAELPCLYLIRPDGYVAFRAQPPERTSLEEFLNRIFVHP